MQPSLYSTQWLESQFFFLIWKNNHNKNFGLLLEWRFLRAMLVNQVVDQLFFKRI